MHARIWMEAAVLAASVVPSGPLCSAQTGDRPADAAVEIVADAAFQRLPEWARVTFEPLWARMKEAATHPLARTSRDALPPSSWYLGLDAEAADGDPSARLAAALQFPHDAADARRLFNRLGRRAGGRLPWVLKEKADDLARAVEQGDARGIIRFGGQVLALSTSAALPFQTTVHREGPSSTVIRVAGSDRSTEFAPCVTARGRVERWYISRRAEALRPIVMASSSTCGTTTDVVEAAFDVMVDASTAYDVIRAVDTELITRWDVKDASSLAAMRRTVLAELDARVGALMASRLDAGACLAAGIVGGIVGEPVGARSTSPVVGAGSPDRHPIPVEQPRLVGSKNSKKFHLGTCRHAGTIKPENLVIFKSVEDALRAGREPCSVCKPGRAPP